MSALLDDVRREVPRIADEGYSTGSSLVSPEIPMEHVTSGGVDVDGCRTLPLVPKREHRRFHR